MRITDCERAHIVVSGARGENARQAAAPGQLVEQARRLAEKAEELLEQAVIAERARNTSWDQIGQALGGLSKSAAHKRYGSVYNEWNVHLDGTSTEDEDTGAEILGEYANFDIAYALLERTWGEIDEVVADQELLYDLRNATLAASGQSAQTGGQSDGGRDALEATETARKGVVFTSTGSGKTQALAYLLTKHPWYWQDMPAIQANSNLAYVTAAEHSALEARLAAVERRLDELDSRTDDY
jgi:hypothetical protein